MDKQRILSITAIMTTTLFWGLSYSSTKTVLAVLSPAQIGFFRFLIAALIWNVICYKPTPIQPKLRKRVIIAGLVGIPVYFLFENTGLTLTSAINGSLIISTIPALNGLIGFCLLRERLPKQQLAGVLCSILGVFAIILSQTSGLNGNLLGNILMIGAACSWVVFTRINQPLVQELSTPILMKWHSTIGALAFALITFPEGRWQDISPADLTLNVWMHLLFLGIFCSAIAYVFYLFAQRNLGITATTTFLNTVPVFGVLGGYFLLNEKLTLLQFLGGLVVIFGVWLVTKEAKKREIEVQIAPSISH